MIFHRNIAKKFIRKKKARRSRDVSGVLSLFGSHVGCVLSLLPGPLQGVLSVERDPGLRFTGVSWLDRKLVLVPIRSLPVNDRVEQKS